MWFRLSRYCLCRVGEEDTPPAIVCGSREIYFDVGDLAQALFTLLVEVLQDLGYQGVTRAALVRD